MLCGGCFPQVNEKILHKTHFTYAKVTIYTQFGSSSVNLWKKLGEPWKSW
jgi:hypothetical protein